MRFALALCLALCLALAACSADPILTLPDVVTADTGPGQVCTPGAQVACTCVGGSTGAQVCSSDGRSLGACECPDAGSGIDAGSDAPVVDAGNTEAAVIDVPVDVPRDSGTDAGRDAGVDIPRDTGPADAGPMTYSLDMVRAGLEVRVAFVRVSSTGSRTVCDAPTSPTCSVSGGFVSFNLHACFGGSDLTGRVMVGNGDRPSAVALGLAGGQFLPTARITSGVEVGGRRSFLVQFAGPARGSASGAEGIPGRTVDPALGDLWLLGCEVQ